MIKKSNKFDSNIISIRKKIKIKNIEHLSINKINKTKIAENNIKSITFNKPFIINYLY
jgi:hypothetical protein